MFDRWDHAHGSDRYRCLSFQAPSAVEGWLLGEAAGERRCVPGEAVGSVVSKAARPDWRDDELWRTRLATCDRGVPAKSTRGQQRGIQALRSSLIAADEQEAAWRSEAGDHAARGGDGRMSEADSENRLSGDAEPWRAAKGRPPRPPTSRPARKAVSGGWRRYRMPSGRRRFASSRGAAADRRRRG